jgi:hypothetical protein
MPQTECGPRLFATSTKQLDSNGLGVNVDTKTERDALAESVQKNGF